MLAQFVKSSVTNGIFESPGNQSRPVRKYLHPTTSASTARMSLITGGRLKFWGTLALSSVILVALWNTMKIYGSSYGKDQEESLKCDGMIMASVTRRYDIIKATGSWADPQMKKGLHTWRKNYKGLVHYHQTKCLTALRMCPLTNARPYYNTKRQSLRRIRWPWRQRENWESKRSFNWYSTTLLYRLQSHLSRE